MNYTRTIYIEGPAGNAMNLIATAKSMAKDIGENGNKIVKEMMETEEYDSLVETFLFYFGDYVDLVDRSGDSVKERYINND
tara:strand:+ start:415 stop:657 length:243 start_codon:yes stop_codon:yes gene_type:complete